MKKGFTLVELLVVVVVLVTLMAMTFRLGSIGSDQAARNTTVNKLQRLENCLSGYYAAYGTYPPVRLHGVRDYQRDIGLHGLQSMDENDSTLLNWSWYDKNTHSVINEKDEKNAWRKVQAACKSQPVDCRFPFPSSDADGSQGGWNDYIKAVSDELKSRASSEKDLTDEQRKVFGEGFDDGITVNPGRHSAGKNLENWQEVQLFKFGLMSFFLPRYLVMMKTYKGLYEYDQWKGNNNCPSDPMTGVRFPSWDKVRDYAIDEKNASDLARVANIPSQAATARWMANLEGLCECYHEVTVFGITIGDGNGIPVSFDLEIFSPSKGSGGEKTGGDTGGGQYVLDGITIRDGWDQEFYYYSPPPYQSYVLWSSGPNKRTFPPWVAREQLNGDAKACVGYWTEDDIIGLSH